ncbi:Transient receptor potential channel pyrexia [Daphnia sinensis]|uniref:Transient receptor potential channel pyrexia n=1 Tax=Daphnia sinensis TaxID=1820382 RepID=A0AAD5L3V3_9CRUS|nr:Transient receptor potential channel pyrexia [Daphnia sinensis]
MGKYDMPSTLGDQKCSEEKRNKDFRTRSGRAKVRKYANRQAFQDRRKPWTTTNGATCNPNHFDNAVDDPTFSISSESNTSRTELKNCTIQAGEPSLWLSGSSVWTEDQLKNGIDELLSNQEASSVHIKTILASTEQSRNWCELPSSCYNAAILYASMTSNIAMLRFYLQRGASPKAADAEQRTALHYAASSSAAAAADCIISLREYGAEINPWDKLGIATPLICAAAAGNADAVKVLLHAGADVNAGLADPKYPDSSTPLVWAVRARSVTCAIHLLEAGAAVNSPQAYSEAPIHVAATQGDTDLMELLLQKKADIRVLFGRERMSALHLAAERGNSGCIHLLLNAKADCNTVNFRGQTPLHLATLSQSVESVAALLEAGARHDICDNELKSPLHSAIIKTSRSTDIVHLLITAGADINRRDNFGCTPLHLAAINENSKAATVLVQAGADLSAKTKGGVSALDFLVRRTPDVLATIPRRLDSAVIVADHDPLDPDCELHLDFNVIVPGGDQQRVGETGFLITLVAAGQRHILQHPIIRAFLHLKWFKIRSLFIVSLLFHAAFVFSLSANILSIYVVHRNRNCSVTNNQQPPLNNESDVMWDSTHCLYPQWPLWLQDAFKYLNLAFGALSLGKEFFQLLQTPSEYVRSSENYIQCFLIVGVVAINLPKNLNHGDWQQHMAAIIIVVAWMELMMHVGRFPVFGLYVQMFTTVAANIAKFLTAYMSLIIGFSLGLSVLYPETESLARLPYSLVTTVVMMTGELEYSKYFYDDYSPTYPITTLVVFLAFLLFIVVVLMNLLVGLAVSDIQGLRKSAGLDRLVRQTRLIARMESIVFSPWLNQLPCWFDTRARKFIQRKILVVPPTHHRVYTVRPNDPRDNRFPPDIKDNILKILLAKPHKQSYRELHRNNTNQSSPLTEELFDELIQNVHRLCHNCVSQIVLMNSSVENRLSKLENQWISTKKQLDTLIGMLTEKSSLSGPTTSGQQQNANSPGLSSHNF